MQHCCIRDYLTPKQTSVHAWIHMHIEWKFTDLKGKVWEKESDFAVSSFFIGFFSLNFFYVIIEPALSA